LSTCSACGVSNREGRRFCAGCGKPLPQLCASCGFANEADDKFCGGCGVALAAHTLAVAATTSESAESERRPATVLFADLVGFTRMSQELDAEEVHRLLERYFEATDSIVESYGGSIDKHIGDSVMAVFGAPVAHGDDGARALRAAVDIHRAVAVLGCELERDLQVHIGVAAGEVIASGLGSSRHRAYTVIGASVNIAARLQQLARAGETVLDGAVHAAVGRIAHCEPIVDVELKGVDAALSLWRLIELRTAAPHEATHRFVGRTVELTQLTTLLHASRRVGAGSVVCVRGDAGMGKSRLIAEMRRVALADGFASH